ncbi:hypothetical protein ACP70R_034992 [Stipagrostis hirtigluma subsp. patula]
MIGFSTRRQYLHFFRWEHEYVKYLRQLQERAARGRSGDVIRGPPTSSSIEVSSEMVQLKKGNGHCMEQLLEMKQDLCKLQRQMDEQHVEMKQHLA